MLIVALAAVLFGVIAMRWGFGIILAVLTVPALVRTIGIQVRRRAAGAPLSPSDKVLAFVGSLAVVTVIAVSAIAAFAAICFPAGLFAMRNGDAVARLGWIVGTMVGLAVAFILGRWLWPARRTWLRMNSTRGDSAPPASDAEDKP
ncbi:MAG: hypothetical protein KDA63_11115 [Planctomycetales bacterium]|nr:hypothetical protein [Planctomycetales bacterium]